MYDVFMSESYAKDVDKREVVRKIFCALKLDKLDWSIGKAAV